MKRIQWSYELASKEAKKYKTKLSFKKGSGGAYEYCRERKVLDKVCSHMPIKISWTPDLVKVEAAKYKRKIDFKEGSGSAYWHCYDRGILDDIWNSTR